MARPTYVRASYIQDNKGDDMKKKLPKTARHEYLRFMEENPPAVEPKEEEISFAWDEVSTVL